MMRPVRGHSPCGQAAGQATVAFDAPTSGVQGNAIHKPIRAVPGAAMQAPPAGGDWVEPGVAHNDRLALQKSPGK